MSICAIVLVLLIKTAGSLPDCLPKMHSWRQSDPQRWVVALAPETPQAQYSVDVVKEHRCCALRAFFVNSAMFPPLEKQEPCDV